ncbi:MAG: PDZ domain-containing protein [Pirellulaceae bacterium]|nr:PDZ domain-containing protein [Pirellulaceae bacterium]
MPLDQQFLARKFLARKFLARIKSSLWSFGILIVCVAMRSEVGLGMNAGSATEFSAAVLMQEAIGQQQEGQQEGQQEATGERESGAGRQGSGQRRGSGRRRPAQAGAAQQGAQVEGPASAQQSPAQAAPVAVAPTQESESGQRQEGEGRGPVGRGQAPGRGQATGPRIEPAPTTATNIPASWLDQFKWESIGPANMSGRITALAVYEKDPYTWWAASASGGLLKTVNNGYSFEFQFDREAVVSIGDVQVFQQDANILWVGTGEANPRNSVSWGNGVYRSNDGGKSWQHLGLNETFQIGRIALHPTDPNIAYVGALGRLWGSNEQRGVFKTSDGGKTWEKVLYIDDKTGIIDLQMHPTNPEVLVAAAYERLRDGFDGNDPVKKFGPGSGLHKTTDGGKTWTKLTQGLPTCNLGRIGLDWSRSNPDHLYAIIESELIGSGPTETAFLGIRNEAADVGIRVTEVVADGPAANVLKTGDILLQMDDQLIIKADDMTKLLARKKADEEVKLVVVRDGQKVETSVKLVMRPVQVQAQRGSPPRPFAASLGGQRENVQDLQGADGYQYGGVYRSTDAGETWTRINSVNPRPMYYSQVRVDPVDENNIYILGTSLYKSSDGGVTFTGDGHGNEVHVDHHSMWIDPKDSRHIILGNDGGVYVTHDRMKTWDHHNHFAIGQFYHIGIDNTPDYKIYGGLQDNGSWGAPRRSRTGAIINSDWFRIGGGDGFICLVDAEDPDQLYAESQNGAMSRFNLRTGERGSIRPQPPRGVTYRFNWKTPFILSPHNSRIHYSAGNYVFRSYNRGTAVEAISPEITNTNEGSGSAISESPVRAGVVYVGTTDGALWVTQNGGQTWEPIFHVPKAAPAAAPAAQATETPTAPVVETPAPAAAVTPPATAPVAAIEMPAKETPAVTKPTEALTEEVKAEETVKKDDPLTGTWDGRFSTSGGEIAGEFQMTVTLEESGAVAGSMNSDEGSLEMADCQFDREKQTLRFTIQTPFGPIQPQFQLKDQEMTAQLPLPNGEILSISATKRPPVRPLVHTALKQETPPAAEQATAAVPPQEAAPPQEAEVATPATEPAAQAANPAPGPAALASLLPGPRWVSSIEASRYAAGRCYITLDGHRSNDDEVYVFTTEDFGKTWKSLKANLPATAGIAWVIREDIANQNVLYLGCEFSTWVSIDRGLSWNKFSTLPTVAVHELAQHPTSGELIAGTHGRSIWVLDVTPLRQLTAEGVAKTANLLRPNQVTRWRSLPERGSNTTREYQARTPNKNAEVYFTLARPVGSAVLTVKDIRGRELYRTEAPVTAGLNRVEWNLRTGAPAPTGPRPGGAGGAGRAGFGGRGQGIAANGTYLVELTVDGEVSSETITIVGDPDYPTQPTGRGEEKEDQSDQSDR